MWWFTPLIAIWPNGHILLSKQDFEPISKNMKPMLVHDVSFFTEWPVNKLLDVWRSKPHHIGNKLDGSNKGCIWFHIFDNCLEVI